MAQTNQRPNAFNWNFWNALKNSKQSPFYNYWYNLWLVMGYIFNGINPQHWMLQVRNIKRKIPKKMSSISKGNSAKRVSNFECANFWILIREIIQDQCRLLVKILFSWTLNRKMGIDEKSKNEAAATTISYLIIL